MTSALVLEAVLLVGQAFAQEGKGVKVRIAQAAIASAFAPYWWPHNAECLKATESMWT